MVRLLPVVAGQFVVFKVARSGSSWFASLIRGLTDVSFTEEAITAHFGRRHTAREKERLLQRILTGPTTGCSVNPTYCQDVDFGAYRIVVFKRSNIVKTTIASLRGVKERCLGMASNLRPHQCYAPFNASVAEIHATLQRKIAETRFLNTSLPHLTLYYEELQLNKTDALRRFKTYIGLPWGTGEVLKKDRLVKATKDDLSDVLGATFSVLAASFSEDKCLVRMLYSTVPEVFDCFPSSTVDQIVVSR